MAAARPHIPVPNLSPEQEREFTQRISAAHKALREFPGSSADERLDLVAALVWGRSIDEWRAARLVMEEAHAA